MTSFDSTSDYVVRKEVLVDEVEWKIEKLSDTIFFLFFSKLEKILRS